MSDMRREYGVNAGRSVRCLGAAAIPRFALPADRASAHGSPATA